MKKQDAPLADDLAHLGVGQRRLPRTPTTGACLLTWPGGQADGVLLDISLDGAAVSGVSDTPPEIGDGVSLVIETEEQRVQALAEVVSIGDDALAGVVVRMKFDEDAKSNQGLRQLVSESENAFRHEQASIFGHRL